MTPRHFLCTQDWPLDDLLAALDHADRLKAGPVPPLLAGRAVALVFFNPSLRTRTSFEVGAWRLGAHAVVLEPGKGAWPIEVADGAVMDGHAEEHVRDAARVLSRYCDLIAVRAFPTFRDWAGDREDPVLAGFARHATVPVINMESIVHPCQALAHAMTLRERLGDLRGRRYLLTWTYHPRPLNTAVANSALMMATRLGMDVTLLCPDERYLLDERYLAHARANAQLSGGSLRVTHDIADGYAGAHVVYAKSWGSLSLYGRPEEEKPVRDAHRRFIVDEDKMALTADACFSHCLPARRNVKATDAVMDSPRSLIIDEAANRLPVQMALMAALVSDPRDARPTVGRAQP